MDAGEGGREGGRAVTRLAEAAMVLSIFMIPVTRLETSDWRQAKVKKGEKGVCIGVLAWSGFYCVSAAHPAPSVLPSPRARSSGVQQERERGSGRQRDSETEISRESERNSAVVRS